MKQVPVFLVVVVSAVFALGLIMIFSTTSADAMDHLQAGTHANVMKQFFYAVGGLGLALMIQRVGYRAFLEASPLILAGLTLALILCFVPGIGKSVNGARRWIHLGGMSFQPSEFVKIAAPAFVIFCLNVRAVALVTVPVFLIMIEPNNGTAGVVASTLVVLCWVYKVPAKYWAIPLMGFTIIAGAVAWNMPYVRARLNVYMHPELDLKGKGHQPYQAKIAAGSGGLVGKGPGASLQKFSYLPEAENDYIAAIYAEEFGFVGILLLVALYMSYTLLGMQIAYLAKDPQAAALATVLTFLVAFQAFMNLGVVSGLLPSTGLNLPFFSQGGTSLLANLTGVGLLYNIGSGRG